MSIEIIQGTYDCFTCDSVGFNTKKEGRQESGLRVYSLGDYFMILTLAGEENNLYPYPFCREDIDPEKFWRRLLFTRERMPLYDERLAKIFNEISKTEDPLWVWSLRRNEVGEALAKTREKLARVISDHAEHFDVNRAIFPAEGIQFLENGLIIGAYNRMIAIMKKRLSKVRYTPDDLISFADFMLYLLNPVYPREYLLDRIVSNMEEILSWLQADRQKAIHSSKIFLDAFLRANAEYIAEKLGVGVEVLISGDYAFIFGCLPKNLLLSSRANELVNGEKVVQVLGDSVSGPLQQPYGEEIWALLTDFFDPIRILHLDGNNRVVGRIILDFLSALSCINFEEINGQFERFLEERIEDRILRENLRRSFNCICKQGLLQDLFNLSQHINTFEREGNLPIVIAPEEIFFTRNPQTGGVLPPWMQRILLDLNFAFGPKGQSHGRGLYWPVRRREIILP